MTLQEFEKSINEYKKDYSISDEEFDAIQRDDVEKMINRLIKIEASKDEELLKSYLALFARNLIRFIDTEVIVSDVVKLEEYNCKFVAKQSVEGEIALTTYIEAEEDSFIKFASKFAEEELTAVDEMAEASVGEFLNLHNGIFIVNMSNSGVELELTPQEVYSNLRLENIYKVSIGLSFGEINLLISE